MKNQPFLMRGATIELADLVGTTILTRTSSETTDEQDPPAWPTGGGVDHPWLASSAVLVTGDLSGKTIATKAMETTDEGDVE